MITSRIYLSIFALMISFLSFGQIDKSELITLKDKYFIESIQEIIKPENNCAKSSRNHNWYIESQADGSYLVSINRIGNLLHTLEDKKIYTTIINNQIVFFITQTESDFILKTGYFIDLIKYKDFEYVLFEDFSSWLITKNEEENYVVKDKRMFKCND